MKLRRTNFGRKPNVVVVASNLHVGGGVQVAASLIDEWSRLAATDSDRFDRIELQCEISPEVNANLTEQVPSHFEVVTRSRRPRTLRYLTHDLRTKYDRAFVVFGPHYFPLRASWLATGYADVTSLYPSVDRGPEVRGRIKNSVRRTLSISIAQRADLLLVETQAIADRCSIVMRRRPITCVVPNAINDAVRSGTAVPAPMALQFTQADERLLLYTTRDYPHKNLEFLPEVRQCAAELGVGVRFLVTLSSEEWASRSVEFRGACLNVGPVKVEQIAGLHDVVAGVFFPSLMEASSATPIEAMTLGTPLFASDRDFVRTVAGDAAHYFDPADAAQAARVIASVLAQPATLGAARERGLARASALPTAQQRADSVLSLLCGEAPASPSRGVA